MYRMQTVAHRPFFKLLLVLFYLDGVCSVSPDDWILDRMVISALNSKAFQEFMF